MSIIGSIIVYRPLNRQTVPGPTTAEIASLYCSKSVSPYKTVRYKIGTGIVLVSQARHFWKKSPDTLARVL